MEKEGKFSFIGLNSMQLKCLAMLFMFLDHAWATIVPGNLWMTCVGRLAFPIFAFQIVEGYFLTSDFKKYLKRIFVFALISEIPFNLIISANWFYPFHQNVLFTFFIALICIDVLENKPLVFSIPVTLVLTLLSGLLMVDYGICGVLTVLVFYFSRNKKFGYLFQAVCLIIINCYIYEGQFITFNLNSLTYSFPVQSFAVFSLPIIWLYNGEKGIGGKIARLFGYWFYPLHALFLYFIWRFLY
jgi:hypothetical protein